MTLNIIPGYGLTFDDVWLEPRFSSIDSRFSPEISLKTNIFPAKPDWGELKLPLISANMDTVTEVDMAETMYLKGGAGIIHRFISIEEHVKQLCMQVDPIVCIGVGTQGRARMSASTKANPGAVLVDVAHGHSLEVVKQIEWLRKNYSDVPIVAGNVATSAGARKLIEAGADCIKVGVGPGSLCSTRVQTGCGVPQVTALSNVCHYIKDNKLSVGVIADGGIRSSGDIMKALAIGADAVMIGNLLAGTDETPGSIKRDRDGSLYKVYRGMASREAQEDWKGYARAIEGEAMRIPYKGPASPILEDLTAGMRSCMTYQNARSLDDLRKHATFTQVTVAGVRESYPHGLEK